MKALEAVGLTAGYGSLAACRDVDLNVNDGEVVALLGPNGAGKTTLLRALAGAIRPMRGTVKLAGEPISAAPHSRFRRGLVMIPEERAIFARQSVRDNLRLGRNGLAALDHFPELTPLLSRRAGLLSGGEQQMVSIGRALAADPKVLLIDELSIGLAPLIVDRLLAAVRTAAKERNVAVLLVEQQARRALEASDRFYVMKQGTVNSADNEQVTLETLGDTYFSTAQSLTTQKMQT
jgi:branched-chain amino acid transport system ATP-binding protein